MALNSLFCADVPLSNYSLTFFDGPGLGEGGVGIFVEAFGRVLTERVGGFVWNVNSVERDSVCVPIDEVLTVANEAYESDGFVLMDSFACFWKRNVESILQFNDLLFLLIFRTLFR